MQIDRSRRKRTLGPRERIRLREPRVRPTDQREDEDSDASHPALLRERYFLSVVPTSVPIAPNVVCAAFSPSRKSLSLNVEKRSVG